MRVYLRKDLKRAYILPKRTGSSFFYHLYNTLPSINSCYLSYDSNDDQEWRRFYQLLDKNTEIYFTFRDPWRRFISGLNIIFYKFDKQKPAKDYLEIEELEVHGLVNNDTVIKLFNEFNKYLDESSSSIGSDHFYHLGDTHTDHILAVPAILAYAGYNIKLIYTDTEWTKHLINSFPVEEEYILNAPGRPSSPYHYTRFTSIVYWEIYKQIFVQKYGKYINTNISWENWMAKEYDLYNLMYVNRDLFTYKDELLKIILENEYFMPDSSPLTDSTVIPIINILNELNKPVHPDLLRKINHFKFLKKIKRLG